MRKVITIGCAAAFALAVACSRPAGPAGADSAAPAAHASGSPQTVRVSAENTDAAEPAVAAGRDGTAYVAWVEHRAGGADVWVGRFDGGGKPLAPPARVNAEPGAATAWRGDPPAVALAPDGTIYVTWTSRAAGAGGAAVQLSASRDGGRSFAAPVKVNDDATEADHGLHSLAVAPDGRLYVAWLDDRRAATEAHAEPAPGAKHAEGNRELFFASSSDGGRTFNANRRVASEVCPCCKTSLALAADGRVYVSWRQVLPGNFRHIAVASSADGGQTFTPPAIVSDDRWQLAGCPVSGAALSVAPDGVLRVLWYSAGEGGKAGLYHSESRDGGRTFAPRALFAETSVGGTPSLVDGGGGGGPVAVWHDRSGGAARIEAAYLAGGRQSPAGFALAEAGELPAASAATGRIFVAYTAGDAGRRELRLVSATPPARADVSRK
jgi:hypothetical protein